jgi:hypothetical protein
MDPRAILAAAQPLLDLLPPDVWLVHEVVKKPNGKLDKPPAPGFRSNDSTTWCSLTDAVSLAQSCSPTAGVSFAIVNPAVSCDFDDCVEPDGTVAPDVAEWIDRLDSFAYRTVSGTGMRVVCRNDEENPITPGKHTGYLPGGFKVEIFVGPCDFYNTFSPRTNGKPVAERTDIVQELLDQLTNRTGGSTAEGNAGSNHGEFGRTSDLGKRARNVDDLLSALQAIPHDEAIDRALWVKIGAGAYSGTDGSERGRTAFLAWSATWHRHDEDPEGHTADAEKVWDSFAASPPRSVGAGTVIAIAKKHGWTRAKASTATSAGGFTIEKFVDVQIEEPRDFVENLLELDTMVMIFGPPSAGKTFLALDLLLHVAWGQPWFGREIDQGPALLVVMEGKRGVERRIAAFRQQHGLMGEDLPFRFIRGPLDLTDTESVDALIKAIRTESRALGRRIRVVAIDTLAAAVKGDENASEVMSVVLANCQRIREKTGECCLILVHHPGKVGARGPRGFSGIGGMLDTLIEIEPAQRGQPRKVIACASSAISN